MGGWWRWALVNPSGVAPSQVCVSASVNLPLHHTVQKFSSGTSSPGWSWKRVIKRLCVCVCVGTGVGVCQHGSNIPFLMSQLADEERLKSSEWLQWLASVAASILLHQSPSSGLCGGIALQQHVDLNQWSYFTVGQYSTEMGDRLWTGKLPWYVNSTAVKLYNTLTNALTR